MANFNSCYLLLQLFLLLGGVEVARSCFHCFTTPAQRDQICHRPVSLHKMDPERCLQKLHAGFLPLNSISIAFSEIPYIKGYLKIFEKDVKSIDKSLSPPDWVHQFEITMAKYVQGVRDRVERHPPEQCRPPCGLQKAARTFTCNKCAEEDCNVPVACPLETLSVSELDQITIPCGASFPLPEDPKVSWKFAKNIRVADLSYFKHIKHGDQLFLLIKPVRMSHRGTYVCEVTDDDDDIILRKFHYLDVIQSDVRERAIMDIYFQRALVEKSPTQLKEEETTKQGPSTMDTILATLQNPIAYAVYAGIFLLAIILLARFLWYYALSVDWRKQHLQSPV
ncbi:sperm acrosome membrane-associated protein 6-like isoform X1 [Engystomops pustulosus]|uniref:sperm acrosome membrane-associated protein 6-like isoform X1 n=1 Tax=Engystomops pustulosus TaxID=76066 RepID=UPI003AFB1418